ncbi:hypothetical protein [Ulvibacter antarcticus]|uniref:Uncharacterized protein n=1 Tax=Ulvibacter antarcticus TaxID=442714 RepID=A0A3L9YVU5_9FLAO|nr:hypothetical protein [Ulvibacter antarcticus]RMA58592.1 hypothetical protein BXY75_1965 [Ulvibacter antarcticus]
MEQSNLEQKEENFRKLGDILNTCESLVEKVGHLQVDLFNAPDKDLEKILDILNNDFSAAHQLITEYWHTYEDKITQLRK